MSNFVYQLSEDSDFLMHHGIKGQKWGVENGPPYPLSAKDYSAAEKRQNRIKEDLNYARDLYKGSKIVNKEYNKNKSDANNLIDKMNADKAVRDSINSLNRQINKMPKDSKYFNKFIADTTKEIDNMVKSLEKSSIKDESTIKAMRKYQATKTSGDIIGGTLMAAGAAVGGTLATIGGLQVGIFAPALTMAGVGLGVIPGAITQASNDQYAHDQLQKYLDKKAS